MGDQWGEIRNREGREEIRRLLGRGKVAARGSSCSQKKQKGNLPSYKEISSRVGRS